MMYFITLGETYELLGVSEQLNCSTNPNPTSNQGESRIRRYEEFHYQKVCLSLNEVTTKNA